MGARRSAILIVLGIACALCPRWLTDTVGGASPVAAPPSAEWSRRSIDLGLADYSLPLARARGTVSIAKRGHPTAFASGVLLAPDLVLTCRHVTHVHGGSSRRRPHGDLEVRLEGELPSEAGAPTRAFPVLCYAHTSEALDLCVLQIGGDTSGRLPTIDRVQTLSPVRAALGDPLYVVHHPRGGPLRVADGARVLFPFAATRQELGVMEERIRDEVGERAARSLVAQLQASYWEGEDGRLLNFSRQWAGQPTLGADCCTADGSSGAPVYHRRTHALLGILFAGADRAPGSGASSWSHHEAILPAEAILEDLAESACEGVRRLAAGTREFGR